MPRRAVHPGRWAVAAMVAVLLPGVGLGVLSADAQPAAPPPTVTPAVRAVAPGPFVSLIFSRTEMGAADGCVADSAGIASLGTTVAPYLRSLGMPATGTLVTDKVLQATRKCTHARSSLMASWNDAAQLASAYGWTFVSHTATYPADLTHLTPARAEAETCGSAETIDAHGLPGGHGYIAYPGAQAAPTSLQAAYSARCFAWGRLYGSSGLTAKSAGTTAPFWQHTKAANGGACNDRTLPCYTLPVQRYNLPSTIIGYLKGLGPGTWFTFQTYILVTGRSPAYAHSTIAWDCTSANPAQHWTNDNERWCYSDYQAVIAAIAAVPHVTVTDPLTVGTAFGRPSTYPTSVTGASVLATDR